MGLKKKDKDGNTKASDSHGFLVLDPFLGSLSKAPTRNNSS